MTNRPLPLTGNTHTHTHTHTHTLIHREVSSFTTEQEKKREHQERRTERQVAQCLLQPFIMESFSLLLLSLLLGVCCVHGAEKKSDFRVCAFNLQHFGESKSKKSHVMHTLCRIISRCDITLLQEVRDSKEKALPALMEQLNRYDPDHVYRSVASERLGRSESYQEQYVFIYRDDTVSLTGQFQYPDKHPGSVDVFSREPFVVRFKAPQTDIKEFVLIPQHTSPDNATKELDALYDVLKYVMKMWKTENVMLLGDFNADCGYLAKKNRKFVRLLTERNLYWLIPEKTDTTVRESTSCAYDRIVVHGETFARAIVPNSAKPFNFQTEYRLQEDQALEVSDHYPVEVLLKSDGSPSGGGVTRSVHLFWSLMVLGHLVVNMLSR